MSATDGFFQDYDDAAVYREVRGWLESPNAHNFVLEFGQKEAKIARDLDAANFERLIKADKTLRSPNRPVRWM